MLSPLIIELVKGGGQMKKVEAGGKQHRNVQKR